jgi:hypothetical protein
VSVCLSAYLSVCLSACLSLSVFHSVSLSVCLSAQVPGFAADQARRADVTSLKATVGLICGRTASSIENTFQVASWPSATFALALQIAAGFTDSTGKRCLPLTGPTKLKHLQGLAEEDRHQLLHAVVLGNDSLELMAQRAQDLVRHVSR